MIAADVYTEVGYKNNWFSFSGFPADRNAVREDAPGARRGGRRKQRPDGEQGAANAGKVRDRARS